MVCCVLFVCYWLCSDLLLEVAEFDCFCIIVWLLGFQFVAFFFVDLVFALCFPI